MYCVRNAGNYPATLDMVGALVRSSNTYFLALEDATPATVYVAPVLAFLLTAVLGMVVVARAQKRERGQLDG